MIFYHFTSRLHWPSIQKQGLRVGDVPITPTEGLNAVWLTTDSNAGRQGWTAGLAKTDIRIKVDISQNSSKLKKWSEFATESGCPQWWYEALDHTGSGGSDNWWLYFGVIPPSEFLEVFMPHDMQKQALRDDLIRLAQILKLRFSSADVDELKKVEKISKDMNLWSEWANGGINVYFQSNEKVTLNAFKKQVEKEVPRAADKWRSIEGDMGSGRSPFWGG